MEQLTGLDHSFLIMEKGGALGHVASISLFRDPDANLGDLDKFKQRLAERIHLAAPFRRRLVEVPFTLDRPYWIEDPDFDLDNHLKLIHLGPGATREELAELVEQLHAEPLDRSRPLWEITMIDGLEGGMIGQFAKTHHAAIDGLSGVTMLASILDLEPDPPPAPAPDHTWTPERPPSTPGLLLRAGVNTVLRPRRALKMTRSIASASVGLLGRRLPNVGSETIQPEKATTSATKLTGPKTVFNQRIIMERTVAFDSFDLEEIKRIKNQFGVTINDVFVAMCAGALRTTLIELDDLPEEPLLAMVPTSTRAEGDERLGNVVAAMFAVVPTHLSDPVAQLFAAQGSMNSAKDDFGALPADLFAETTEATPPALLALAGRMMASTPLLDVSSPIANLTISNVPGPQFPLYGLGAELIASFPISAVTHGVGLNITAMSYNGKVDIGVVAAANVLADAWPLMDHLHTALADLGAAADAAAAVAKARTSAKEAPQAQTSTKTGSGKSSAKKTSAKKSPAKRTSAKKSPAKKTSARKTSAKKTSAKKAPAKKTSAKKARAARSATKTTSIEKKPIKKSPKAKSNAAKRADN